MSSLDLTSEEVSKLALSEFVSLQCFISNVAKFAEPRNPGLSSPHANRTNPDIAVIASCCFLSKSFAPLGQHPPDHHGLSCLANSLHAGAAGPGPRPPAPPKPQLPPDDEDPTVHIIVPSRVVTQYHDHGFHPFPRAWGHVSGQFAQALGGLLFCSGRVALPLAARGLAVTGFMLSNSRHQGQGVLANVSMSVRIHHSGGRTLIIKAIHAVHATDRL